MIETEAERTAHDLPEEQLNRYLYGSDPTERIVAVERGGSDKMRVYRRVDGAVVEERVTFRPWLLMTAEPAWPDLAANLRTTRLEGEGAFCWFVECRNWSVYQDLRTRLRDADADVLAFASPIQQYLTGSGRTLFKGMVYDDLLRLQIDLETTSLDTNVAHARVFLVSTRTSAGEERLFGAAGEDEATLLEDLTAYVRALDPDVIEGHNVFNFDLPYLLARAAANGVTLAWGRDGSALRPGNNNRTQFKVAARSVPYQQHFVYGRHLIDTYQQIQRYDVAGNLSSYGLKPVIEALGYTRDDREFIPGEEIAKLWEEDRTRVLRYALDDVRDVAILSDLCVPTEFYQSQIVPDSLQDTATGGPGEKINDLMVRIYLGERRAIPKPEPPHDYPGGYADVLRTGVFKPVVKCDVASMYPSIMLTWKISSRHDSLGVTLPLLRTLTERRLHAKVQARRTTGREQGYWQGIQGSFKVLINSFYGNLGYSRAYFNDFDAAEEVTLKGQEIIKSVVRALKEAGATPIEVDTDGVYFVPPPDVPADDERAEEAFLQRIAMALPAGIDLSHDGSYAGMVSLKVKNYALIDHDGSATLKGGSLRSRREEPILRAFLRQAVVLFVEGSRAAVRDLYLDTALRIQHKEYQPYQICRWETVSDKTFSSESNKRLAEAARGVAVGERIEVYQKIDGSLGRLENYARDEDTTYLLRRLRDMADRFTELFEDARDHDYHFPLLTATSDITAARAARPVKQLGLF